MRQSQLFTKTLKRVPKEEVSESARLLLRAGFIDKLSAGIYTFLPLGLRVIEKIERIIDEEMRFLGAQRVLMPSLIPKKNWETTGRWRSFSALFKLKGKTKIEYALGSTHEEVIVPLVKKHVSSWKDLPIAVFQIQNKFRDELRTKSGILRTREFLMKDLYSFHTSEKELELFYEEVKNAYQRIFRKLKIASQTYLTLASGGTFSRYSHEYQTVTPAGEDTVYICQKCKVAINKELKERNFKCWRCQKGLSEEVKTIEVANIFKLKEKYTKPFDFRFTDRDGKKKLVTMGCYGIGLPRLMGAVVELHHDSLGIIWPFSIAPFDFHLIEVGTDARVRRETEKIYKSLQKAGHEVIYDDRRDIGIGEKFMDCDLMGIPWRIIVSQKTLEKEAVEIKKRGKKKLNFVKIKNLSQFLRKTIKC